MTRKRHFLQILMIITSVIFVVGTALADDVLVQVRLDKSATKATFSNNTWKYPAIIVTLVIQNFSDRIQSVEQKNAYRFSIQRVWPTYVEGYDPPNLTYYSVVAKGRLKAIGERSTPYIQIEPHTEKVVAFGAIPISITEYNTYGGQNYLVPGAYRIFVEIPTGLAGTQSYTTAETIFFIR